MIFEIFKTGTHTNSNGVTKNFTTEDLDQIVNSYNPEEREAPLVIGHPKDNDPAFGWVEKLFRKGESLFAKTKDEDPAFVKAVKERKFPKRSISLTPDLRLNHIGFLGAVLPAVDGLSPVKFNADDEIISFYFEEDINIIQDEFNSPVSSIENGNLDSSKGEELNSDKSDNPKLNMSNSSQSPNYDSSGERTQPQINNTQSNKNKPPNLKTPLESYSNILSDISDSLKQLKTFTESFQQNFANSDVVELKESERNKIYDQLNNLRMQIDVNNFEVLLNEKMLYGSITPVMKNKITKTLKFLRNQNFENFDPDNFILELQHQILDFVNSIPKIVNFSNFAEKPDDIPGNLVNEDYDGLAVEPNSEAIHKKILQTMMVDNIDYQTALKKVIYQ